MRKRGMPAVHGSEVNVTPLIDVIMCLIVFFMLAAKIGVSSGADPTITVPESILGKRIEELGDNLVINVKAPAEGSTEAANNEPIVTVMKDGQALSRIPLVDRDSEGRPIQVSVEGKTQVSHPLRFLIKDMKAAHNKDKTESGELSVTIHAEKDLEFKYLDQVLGECTSAGCSTWNFETSAPQGG